MKIVIFGLSITSSWGNGHATTFRALVGALAQRGHEVLFLERDLPWYAGNRDLPVPPYCRLVLYASLSDLAPYVNEIAEADCVIVGSFVPDGIPIGEWVTRIARGRTAFYDIDTPVTLTGVERAKCSYLSAKLIPQYQLYLSFTGGPILDLLERKYGSPAARAFHCSVDPERYFPHAQKARWDLAYLGTYSADRQPALTQLLVEPASHLPSLRFAVAGSLYPKDLRWPRNVERVEHLSPGRHCAFYNSQRFTLNVTREEMLRAGWSPSVRLFEAAACGIPIISDLWDGLETFFEPGREILTATAPEEVVEILEDLPEAERLLIGTRARERVLATHTAAHRAAELETLIGELPGTTSVHSKTRPPKRAARHTEEQSALACR
jgi:spore maturation protein CgeB